MIQQYVYIIIYIDRIIQILLNHPILITRIIHYRFQQWVAYFQTHPAFCFFFEIGLILSARHLGMGS